MGENKRELLVLYGKKLLEEGLVQGTWGNLSVRVNDEYMLVTPSGLDYNRLEPEDMVLVHIETLEPQGKRTPTSEKALHGAIYRNRPDVGAIIHTHAKYCSMFAAARKSLPIENQEMKKIFGQDVPVAKYGLPGSAKLEKNTAGAFGDGWGCMMASHGMICGGRTMEEAFDHCCKMESCAEEYIESRWEKGDELR